MNPILVHPEPGIFPRNTSNEFSECGNMADSGFFGIGFAFPRVSLHHSCAACVIVAAPGVIKSAIPAGIFAVPVPAMLVQVRLDLSGAQVYQLRQGLHYEVLNVVVLR